MVGIKPGPPAQQANALSIIPSPLGMWATRHSFGKKSSGFWSNCTLARLRSFKALATEGPLRFLASLHGEGVRISGCPWPLSRGGFYLQSQSSAITVVIRYWYLQKPYKEMRVGMNLFELHPFDLSEEECRVFTDKEFRIDWFVVASISVFEVKCLKKPHSELGRSVVSC